MQRCKSCGQPIRRWYPVRLEEELRQVRKDHPPRVRARACASVLRRYFGHRSVYLEKRKSWVRVKLWRVSEREVPGSILNQLNRLSDRMAYLEPSRTSLDETPSLAWFFKE